MRLLDLFCGAGGAAAGYHRAGFTDIVGVDNRPQKHYPFEFVQADALDYLGEHGHQFDMIHASPPCQRWSEATPHDRRSNHANLISPTRRLLQTTNTPFVIENVESARHMLVTPVMLCGTMFALNIWRHRYFEIHPRIAWLTPPCQHNGRPVLLTGQGSGRPDGTRHKKHTAKQRREASQLTWMSIDEMSQAIPPAYTEYIGAKMLSAIRNPQSEIRHGP